MKKAAVLIMISLFFGCNKKKDNEVQKPYVISEENKEKINNNDSVPPPPPIPGWLVYGTNTFILNSDSTAYYFQNKEIGMICGTPTADTIPYFINLHPKDLIEISNKNIYDFIRLNYKDDFRNVTFIASQSDTLYSKKMNQFERLVLKSFYHILLLILYDNYRKQQMGIEYLKIFLNKLHVCNHS